VPSPRTTTDEVVRFTIEPSPTRVVTARRRLRALLVDAGLDDGCVADVVLASSELITNAVESARPGSDVHVEVTFADAGVTVTVENEGPAFHLPIPPALPDPSAVRGRGLAITSMLAEHVRTEHVGGRNRVSATLPVRSQRATSAGD